jgi:hypothetical protein
MYLSGVLLLGCKLDSMTLDKEHEVDDFVRNLQPSLERKLAVQLAVSKCKISSYTVNGLTPSRSIRVDAISLFSCFPCVATQQTACNCSTRDVNIDHRL